MMLHGRPFRGRKEAFFAHEGRKMLRCFFVPEGGEIIRDDPRARGEIIIGTASPSHKPLSPAG